MKEREILYKMYNGRCAYCGCELPVKGWHVDHVKPIYRGLNANPDHPLVGADTIDNKVPACRRCNLWKSTYTVEQFRKEIAAQVRRLRSKIAGYRLAEDFGVVEATSKDVKFYFETI